MVLSRNTIVTMENLRSRRSSMWTSGSSALPDLRKEHRMRTAPRMQSATEPASGMMPSVKPYRPTMTSPMPNDIRRTEGMSGSSLRPRSGSIAGRRTAVAAMMTRHIGMLIRKTACQEKMSPSIPPTVGPAMTDIPLPAAMQPIPRARWSSSRRRTTMIGVEATMNVAPMPWTNLMTTRVTASGDRAHPTDAMRKTVVPIRNILRTFTLSASFENARQSPAMGTRYATETIALDDTDIPRSSDMVGRMTLTMDESIPSMIVASRMRVMTAHIAGCCPFSVISRTFRRPP